MINKKIIPLEICKVKHNTFLPVPVIFESPVYILDRRTPRAGAKRTDHRFPRGLTDLQKTHPLPVEKFLLDFLTIV